LPRSLKKEKAKVVDDPYETDPKRRVLSCNAFRMMALSLSSKMYLCFGSSLKSEKEAYGRAGQGNEDAF
jgi:transposase